MNVFIMGLLAGITYGIVLFLISTGLSLVLGLMGIVNVAHGALFMAGAYFGLWVAKTTGSIVLGIIAGTMLAGVIGLLIERGFLRQLYRRELDQILVTFGFVYIITNLHLWIYGAWPQAAFVPPYLTGSATIGTFAFPMYRFVIILIGLGLCVSLWWLQERTRVGAIIRAGMDDAEMVTGMGINLRRINIAAFCLGACLAGFAGVVGAPVLGGVDLDAGVSIVFVAIAVCIVGGVGSVQGAMVGALLIGIATTLVGIYFPVLAMFVMYILMVLVLICRPSGILGRAR
jgi:branched-chain amino acid transport system permease protein